MATITLILKEGREEALDTMTFLFRAEGLRGAVPGQYLLVKLEAPDDARHGQRSLTMANSPTEEHVMITTRIRSGSAFKRRLAAMRPGDTLEAKGPMGRFIFHEGDAPALFLAGGIGVTPFRSMIKARIDASRQTPITLLVSDRVPEMIAFRKEFDAWAAAHPWLQLSRTVTRPEAGGLPWDGRVGRIDRGWIEEQCPSLDRSIAYVSGPPAFVDTVSGLIAAMDFPADRIRAERFIGY